MEEHIKYPPHDRLVICVMACVVVLYALTAFGVLAWWVRHPMCCKKDGGKATYLLALLFFLVLRIAFCATWLLEVWGWSFLLNRLGSSFFIAICVAVAFLVYNLAENADLGVCNTRCLCWCHCSVIAFIVIFGIHLVVWAVVPSFWDLRWMEETKPLVSPDPFTNHCDLYGSLAVQIVSLAYGGILIVLALVFLYLGYNGLTVPDNKWYQKVFPYALCVLLLLRGVFVELSALRIYCVMFVFVLGAMALPEILITAFVLLYVWGRDESQKPICPN